MNGSILLVVEEVPPFLGTTGVVLAAENGDALIVHIENQVFANVVVAWLLAVDRQMRIDIVHRVIIEAEKGRKRVRKSPV